MSAIHDIPTGQFRVVQAKRTGAVMVNDFESSPAAFAMAKQHNDAIGIEGTFREPYMVFSCLGLLVFGPADGWSRDQIV